MLDPTASLLGPLTALLPPPLAASIAAAISQQSAQPGALSSIGGLSSTTTGAGGCAGCRGFWTGGVVLVWKRDGQARVGATATLYGVYG